MNLKKLISASGYYPYRFSRHPLLGGGGKKFLFIHINKCGGSSIIKTLWPPHKWHDTAREIIAAIGEENYHNTFKFTVVRNPWSRAVSQYNFRVQTNQSGMQEEPIPFKEWAFKVFGEEKDPRYYDDPKMFLPQVDWLKDNEGQISVDKIIRFENLSQEFAEVARFLGLRKNLPHRNPSKRVDFKTYYDEETLALIDKWFAEDIELLGYRFDGQVAEKK